MFRGYRSAVLAAGLILLTLSGQAQEAVQPALEGDPVTAQGQEERGATSDDGPGAEPEAAPDYLPALERIEAAIRDTIAEEDADERERQENRDIADLEAQTDMAFWAKLMFWASFAGVVVTFVGVCLVGWTLHHTKRAADYAEQMVNEAKDTTEAAHAQIEAIKLDQRAWMKIHPNDEAEVNISGVKNYSFASGCYIENVGKSVEIGVFVRSRIDIIDNLELKPIEGMAL